MSEPDTRALRILRLYCRAAAIAVGAIGCLVLIGWAFHIAVLKSVLPGLVTMKANTALSLAVSATSLWLLLPSRPPASRLYMGRLLALFVTLLALATGTEYLFGLNLGIDQLLFLEPLGTVATYSPGRMSPASCTAFIAIGLALLLLDQKRPSGNGPSQLLSLWSLLMATLATTGYAYHATTLSRIFLYTQVALHTAIGLLLLSTAVFFARPSTAIAGDLAGQGSGSIMARRLLPAMLGIPLFLGWISLQGQFQGLYGRELRLALYATANVVVFAALLWLNARKMNVEYTQRRLAEVQIRELNIDLEERVADRTQAFELQTTVLTQQAGLLDLAHEAIIVRDMHNRILFWNPAAAIMYGWPSKLAVGKIMNELLHTELSQPIKEIDRQLLLLGLWEGEVIHNTQAGMILNVETRWALQRDADGSPLRILAIDRDITERKRAEQDLKAAKEAAEAGSEAKSAFLAMMSHEIRTPMNGILGMTELTLDTDLTQEQRDNLGLVKLSAESLLAVLNDILDFSKIEAGMLEFEEIPFSLRASLGDALRALNFRVQQKTVELICDVQAEVPEFLIGDPGRLRQVVTNLVGNAIKFTEKGEIVVSVTEEAAKDGQVCLHVAVADTGMGIPLDRQAKIFDAFSQADGSTSRKFGGTGLGLTISTRLVKMMGGRIWVESEPGKGSTFHFTAWLGIQERTTPPMEADLSQLRDLAVLVVDDNFTNRRVLQAMLLHCGAKPVLTESSQEALDLMNAMAEDGRYFPVAIVDAQMPGIDGFGLVQRMQERPETAGTKTVMLTSVGQRGDASRCRQVGVAGYLLKPTQQSELLETICRVLHPPSPTEPPALVTRHTLREGHRRLRVLLGEDNRVNQTLAVRLLEKRGHVVIVAGNGTEVLSAMNEEPFDLVLMDLHMPGMDGLQASAAIREREKSGGPRLPILALTASAFKEDEERCIAAGMDGYVSKPIRPAELFAAIERVTR